jgi:glycine cleavage system H protein
MKVPDGLRYSEEHEWVTVADGVATIGITDYAQEELGDIVFVELPAVGATLKKGESLGVVESVKAVSDVYVPVSGAVIEVNGRLATNPETINEDPYGEGWMLRATLADPAEIEQLMTAEEYRGFVAEEKKE